MDYILSVKPKVLKQVIRRKRDRTLVELSGEDAVGGSCYGYRFTNGLSLNDSHFELLVNYIEYWQREENDKVGTEIKQQIFARATSLEVSI